MATSNRIISRFDCFGTACLAMTSEKRCLAMTTKKRFLVLKIEKWSLAMTAKKRCFANVVRAINSKNEGVLCISSIQSW